MGGGTVSLASMCVEVLAADVVGGIVAVVAEAAVASVVVVVMGAAATVIIVVVRGVALYVSRCSVDLYTRSHVRQFDENCTIVRVSSRTVAHLMA